MSCRKPGLCFSAMKIEVEDVNPRMKKVCEACEQLPQTRRLKVVKGAGRHQKVLIFCPECGQEWLKKLHLLVGRTKRYLAGGSTSIRLGVKL